MDIADRLGRVFRETRAAAVAARAVERGWLSRAQLEAATDAAEEEGVSLRAVLEGRGWLDGEKYATLEAELGREDFARPALGARGELPPEAQAAARDPERKVDRFILTTLLGRGGAGEVWRAWDPRLRRWVALKIAAAAVDSATARERFEREALAAGRLSHPQIVPIHEVNVTRGRAYLVMPLIEGRTLAEAELPLSAALEAMRVVALALDHAHRHGLVHRDVKPGNIMIDSEGRAFLLDFGVAYLSEPSLATMTRQGDVLGTASYLSPEQARGGPSARQPATDIYGLGATLYHLVTGRPPFVAETFAATVAQVLAAEPPSPRSLNPGIDRRLEQVIRRAMERDVRLRYPTAAAFAEDLRRVLAGEPLAGGAVAHVRSLTLRHGRAFALGAVGVALAVAAGLFARAALRERGSALEAFRRTALASLESGLRLRRAGDVAGMRQVLGQIVAAAEAAQPALARVPEVDYLLGRIHRAQMDEARALSHQERALAHAPDFAPALYERAVLNARRYGQLLQRAKASRWLDPGTTVGFSAGELERLDPELPSLREAILRDGRRLAELRLGEVDAQAVQGLLSHHRGAYAEADRLLREVVKKDPWREEAWEALALALQERQYLDAAEDIYDAALARDAGYLPFWVGRCLVRVARHNRLHALADARRALALAPDLAAAHACSGDAHLHEGMVRSTRGEDPLPWWESARADYDRTIGLDPRSAHGYGGRGTLWRYRARHRLRQGQDPGGDLEAAIADLTRGVTLQPTNAIVQVSRGRAYATQALWELRRGGDPRPALDAARADYDQAIRGEPKVWGAIEWRADLATLRATWLHARGEDPTPAIADAEQDFAKLAAANVNDTWVFIHRAKLRALQGTVAREAAVAQRRWAEAEADLDRALAKDDRLSEALWRRAAVRRTRAAHERDRNKRAQLLAAARADITRSLALDPNDVEALREAERLKGQ